MRKTLLLLISALFFFSCTEKTSPPVSPYVPPQPAPPQIDRDTLIRNNSFQAAYLNGTIRSTRAVISWQQCTDADFLCYRIFRDNTMWIQDIDSAQHAWVADAALQQNTWYRYTVATILKSGRWTVDTITIRTPKFLPPVPSQPRVDTSGAIFLSWRNQAETAQEYLIERKVQGSADFGYLKVGYLHAPDSTFNDRPAATPLNYVYRLSAWNKFEHTAYSETTPVFYSMAAPTLVSVSQIGTSRTVKISFADNSNAESEFRIHRKRQNGVYAEIGRTPANSTQYIDADSAALATDSLIYYMVECYNRTHSLFSSEKALRIVNYTIAFSPIHFPLTNVGSSSTATLTVRNTGTASLVVSNLASSNPRFVPDRSAFTVAAGSSENVSIAFTPLDAGTQTGTLSMRTNIVSNELTLAITATGKYATIPIEEDFEDKSMPSGWTTSDTSGWSLDSDLPSGGLYCVRSGPIPDNASTTLSKTVMSSGLDMVSFDYRVSSQAGHDKLIFSIGGVPVNAGWSGEEGWRRFSQFLNHPGWVTLSWTYSKDAAGSGGMDAAWIDNVTVR